MQIHRMGQAIKINEYTSRCVQIIQILPIYIKMGANKSSFTNIHQDSHK